MPIDWSAAIGTAANVGAALAGGAAVGVAWYAITTSQRESRLRATFEYIRDIEQRTEPLFALRLVEVRARVLEEAKEGKGYSPECILFLRYMNGLNILAYAVRQNLVQRDVVIDFLQNLAHQSDFLFRFIVEYQRCCADSLLYHYAFDFIQELELATIGGHK